MSLPSGQVGAKPAVLRCARCGKFVDWGEAQVQIVCTCRPRLELPPVFVREATDADRPAVRALFESDFGRTKIVAFGEVMDIDPMPALVAFITEELSGALAYRLFGDALHMVALATDPMWQRSGVGGHLVAEAELLARRLNLQRVVVATTNDNLPALHFYQRRGYRLTDLAPNSIIVHTGQEVPGFAGIPVRDEVRMEKTMLPLAPSRRHPATDI
jgi:ribosomal protein S18 acetylase RimI-like enzyme